MIAGFKNTNEIIRVEDSNDSAHCTASAVVVIIIVAHLLCLFPSSTGISITNEMSLAIAGAPREGHVLQAVNFLQDPRVRREPLVRAVHFLRGKNVSDAEVREAFSRLKLPYPETEAAALANGVPWGYQQPPPPQQSAFMGTMMTLGLTAGALYAAREFLRVYVIPRYFPEFVPANEVPENDSDNTRERGRTPDMDARQHNALMQLQERQIETLKQTVEQLREAASTTNERVERLSITLSTASQLAERRQQETAEIRDAIRQLSRTVSASNTPNTNTNHAARSKNGSLAYNGGSTAITIDESQILLTPETEEKFKTPMMTAPNTEKKAVPSTHIADIPQVEDAFLNVAPAEIETHWGRNINDSINSNKVSENRLSIASDKVSSNTASISSSAAIAANAAGTVTDNSEEAKKRTEMLNTTRRLFEKSMKTNTETKTDVATNGKPSATNENKDDNISRRSTKSAPDPELPLTDDDDIDVDDDIF